MKAPANKIFFSRHSIWFLSLAFGAALLSAIAFSFTPANSFWRIGNGQPFALLYSLLPGLIFFSLNIFVFKKKFSFYGFIWNFNVWWLLAWLLPLLILFLQGVLLYYFSSVQADFSLNHYMQTLGRNLDSQEFAKLQKVVQTKGVSTLLFSVLGQAFLFGSTFYALSSLVEESAWRGFLQRQWHEFGFWRASSAIAVLQSLYLLPLVWNGFLFSQQPLAGSAALLFSGFLFSLVLSYLRYRSASLYVSAIARGFFMALWGVPMMFFAEGNALHKHLLGFYAAAAMLITLLLLVVLGRFFSFFALPSFTVLEDEIS